MTVTAHFIERVRERIGPGISPFALARTIVDAARTGDTEVAQFVCRASRNGRRVFRHTLADGRTFFFLIDTEEWRVITVMPPGFEVRRQGADTRVLRE